MLWYSKTNYPAGSLIVLSEIKDPGGSALTLNCGSLCLPKSKIQFIVDLLT